MDPVTISVVAAVAATATAVANGAASAAGKDAWERLKRVIAARFASAQPALAAVEAGPTFAPNREALATQLETTGAFRDAEVREAAQRLLAALIVLRDNPALAPLFDFEELEAAGKFEMTDITALGSVVKVTRDKVFICYSHADAAWLDRLKRVLKPLERKGLVDYWADTRIRPGRDWRAEIAGALASAHTAILMISADFFASDFIAEQELPTLLIAAERDGVEILSVILKPSRFLREPEIARFQTINPPDKPLAGMNEVEQDEVLDQLAQHLEKRPRP